MKQETVNRPHRHSFNASFQQKSTGLSLVIISSAVMYYVANMWPMRTIALENNVIPDGFGSLVAGTVTLIIITQIVLVIGAGSAPTATAHEKLASLKATRNAYGVLIVGLFAAVGTVFLDGLTPFCTANLAILAFALAEIVKYGSQIFYARQ